MQSVSPHPIAMATSRSAHWSKGMLRTFDASGNVTAATVALDESGRASLSRRPLGEISSTSVHFGRAGSAGSAGSAG